MIRPEVRALVGASLLLLPMQGHAQQGVADHLRNRFEAAQDVGFLSVGGMQVQNFSAIATAYRQREYAPLWADSQRRQRLGEALESLRDDGLDPAQYLAPELRTRGDAAGSLRRLAEEDLLRTMALLSAAQHLRQGRLDPASHRHNDNLDRLLAADDALAVVPSLLADDPVAALQRMRPDHFTYEALRRALAALRQQQEQGGWSAVPARVMARDSIGEGVVALRRRLVQEGDHAAVIRLDAPQFDAELDQAVRRYQHRHGLNPDGVVGPATLRELQVPLATRIDQVRVNLERARWLLPDLPATFITVNVAGANVYYIRDGALLMETRAIVGTTATRTPLFTAQMRQIELNPTWTVPPGIVGEILGHIRRQPDYLRANRIRVLDHAGREVATDGIPFHAYTGRTFPYVFRQDPGPWNALGTIKLVFPNSHHVYLHDTPSRQLFDREERTFSHGCIRVQDPVRLAALVLDDPAWSEDALIGAIATGRTRVIPLQRAVPVVVTYWTAAADLHGDLHFYRDIYGRDAALLQALDRR